MSHYAIVDLEMCKVPPGDKRKAFGHSQELIQIGAVLLDEHYETEDTFVTFVRPEYGFVDNFIARLTGIHQSDVENAPTSAEALTAFLNWLPEDAIIVSWSYSDFSQIDAELALKHIDLPAFDRYMDEWQDCQMTFGDMMHTDRSYSLSEALNITALDYSDGEHDALIDARNTALLFRKMKTEPELKLSPYITVEPEEEHLCSAFQNLALSFSPEDTDEEADIVKSKP